LIYTFTEKFRWKISVEIFKAKTRNIDLLSITDHDSIMPAQAIASQKEDVRYIIGVELNVTFSHPNTRMVRRFPGFWATNSILIGIRNKLKKMAEYREEAKILDNLNLSSKEHIAALTKKISANEESLTGFSADPIADYLVKKGIVKDRRSFRQISCQMRRPKLRFILKHQNSSEAQAENWY
jgi:predicted metal-dependent phosphoesterase TrpH